MPEANPQFAEPRSQRNSMKPALLMFTAIRTGAACREGHGNTVR